MSNLRQITLFYRDGQVICHWLIHGVKFVKTNKVLYQDVVLQFSFNNVRRRLFDEGASQHEDEQVIVDNLSLVFEQGTYVGALAMLKSYVDTFKNSLKSSIEKLEIMNKKILESWNKEITEIPFENYFKDLANFT